MSSRDKGRGRNRQDESRDRVEREEPTVTREAHVEFQAAAFSDAGASDEAGDAPATTTGTTQTGTGGQATTTTKPATTPPAPAPTTSRLSLASKSILNELQNISSYPAASSGLTPSMQTPLAGGGASGGGGQPSLQRTVESALQSVLGRLPKAGDQKSFMAALKMSFTYKETTGGRREYEWTPRSFIGQTDLGGGVTGAQASLVSFARSAYDNSLPLLDNLFPLTSVDEQEVEAASAILRTTWTEFINELGREGGARAARADELINSILDDTRQWRIDGRRGGHLTRLGILLGIVETDTSGNPRISRNTNRALITRRRVITPEEEANLTSFIALRDFITSVATSWTNYKGFSHGRDLGTGLVMLSRLFSVVGESVDEVYAAMDSVYLGEAERLATLVELSGGRGMSVEELLSWVSSFALTEAPALIQDGGRWGVEAILPTVGLLEDLTNEFNRLVDEQASKTKPSLSRGFFHPRVRNALSDLNRYLADVEEVAEEVLDEQEQNV
ncbi:MAG TPA: hypothetical protein VGB73_08495 [Pyrinomonadaceae bacterium]